MAYVLLATTACTLPSFPQEDAVITITKTYSQQKLAQVMMKPDFLSKAELALLPDSGVIL